MTMKQKKIVNIYLYDLDANINEWKGDNLKMGVHQKLYTGTMQLRPEPDT